MSWKPLLGIAVLLAGVTGVVAYYRPWQYQPAILLLPGVVEVQEVRLASKVGGRVGKITAREGDLLEPNQPLVYLEVPELEAQKAQLEARLQAALAARDKAHNGSRKEEKEAARAAWDAAKARNARMVRGPREEEKQQARAELASADADLKWAREKYGRTRRLEGPAAATREELEAARAALDSAHGRFEKARAQLDLLSAGYRTEDREEAEAEERRARAHYDLAVEGTRYEDKTIAEAQVEELRGKLRELEVNLQEAVIRAPEKAILDVLSVRKGDVVAPNQPVARVLRADDLWVKVYVPETELGKIRLHQEVAVRVDSYPGTDFQGAVTYVASASEFTPRNVQSVEERRHQVFAVKIRVDDPRGVFKSGMAAEVRLPLQEP